MTAVLPHVSLDDKYTAESGQVLLSGIHALVRLTLEQRKLDAARGMNTGVYVSGYQGSPLGGVDTAMQKAARHLDAAGVVFQPGVNEELAATAVAGTQLLGQLPGRRLDGVTGFWYGKNPGLDRAADAIRHGNVSGTAALGGAVAWIGDDPACKSSTLPSSCEPMCRSLGMPLLAPGTIGEIIEFGLHAVALSRSSGLWTGLKIVADVADASATVDLDGLREGIPLPDTADRGAPPVLLPPASLAAEADLLTARIARGTAYARAARLNRITFDSHRPRFGVMAAGAGYQAVLRALDDLGIDSAAMDALGFRLIRIGMPWPLDASDLRTLVDGLEEVLVVEDKLSFMEGQLKEALYRTTSAPLVTGREDDAGRQLLPVRGTIGAGEVTRALLKRLPAATLPERVRFRARAITTPPRIDLPVLPSRTPFFCSGCPHNTSTKADDGKLVGLGIGCHIMAAFDEGNRGTLIGTPQMGGEGSQWLGLAPFTDDQHFTQNLGDGTFYHSGSLAIRAAVAADARITYKLLYNDAVAMTGGQQPEGKLDVPTLTRWFALEGVRQIIVTTDDVKAYRGVRLDPIAEVRHRDHLDAAQRELAAVDGVTVLLHDDRCAVAERRLRKRGDLPRPTERVWINERVCEGCGDCGAQSTCLSVQPVDTEFGRKTRIHQSSCSQDFSCLKGDCPSFVLVEPSKKARPTVQPPMRLAEPDRRFGADDVLVRMPGVGGTGVVTVSQILQMAAHLDGLHATGLEQTGLAQKGGPVLSDLRISKEPLSGSVRASATSADLLLGFDLLGASAVDTLRVADPGRTVAVLNTATVPTAAMVTDPSREPASRAEGLARIERVTDAARNFSLDAQELAERLFDDHMPANLLLIGAAYQHGCLPMRAEAIEEAIRLNGAAVEVSLAAFRWGRAAVVDPETVAAFGKVAATAPRVERDTQRIVASTGTTGRLRDVLQTRVNELIGYSGEAYAQRYARQVARVAAAEADRTGAVELPISVAFAEGLYKLMAYKDEYEVARLHLDGVERARRDAEFGRKAKVTILLHPPLLRALGLKRKLRFGVWILPIFRLLHAARGLRGTALDPFGYAELRKVERALIAEYETMIDRGLSVLEADNADAVARLAALPGLVRGYEEIKLRTVAKFRAESVRLLGELESGQRTSRA
ncbi:MAG: indolepyruvate ferredoxin oxidoreductase family protein [Pseudonocardiaceae bacterium]